jgi:Fur family ferric uptake transcriptional regulator
MTAKKDPQTEKTKQEVRELFTGYLELHQHRKTPERYAILDEIYSSKVHFDVDELFLKMKYQMQRS